MFFKKVILYMPLCFIALIACRNNLDNGTSVKSTPSSKIKNIKADSLVESVNAISDAKVKNSGVLLNKEWKFSFGDSLHFMKMNYDDSDWAKRSIDDKFVSFDYANSYKVGWFRKKITIDSTMLQNLYNIKVNASGAAEVFFNETLLFKIGRIERTLSKSDVLVSEAIIPYPIDFKEKGEQLIAVRFLFTPQNKLSQNFSRYPLDLRLKRENNDLAFQLNKIKISGFIAGICGGFFFMMSIVHFFFFYLFRSQRFNVLFSIAMFLFGLYFYTKGGALIYHSIDSFVTSDIFENSLFILGHIILLSAVYDYVHYPKHFIFWLMTIIFTSVTISSFFNLIPEYVEAIAFFLLILNYGYIIFQSIKEKQQHGKVLRNALIIFLTCITVVSIGFILLVSFDIVTIKNDTSILLDSLILPLFAVLFSIGPQLSISLATTFSLAKEYVNANISLKEKFNEIDILSKEKQEILSSQNEKLESEVKERTAELEESLANLNAAQSQLIQSEKMASLGELTAGIAHEIKNPLNFVNNFAELNIELIDEMEAEASKGNTDQVIELVHNIKQNLTKIASHGKRADGIVKSMLEHSRKSSGKKEMTDINALVKEYFNLAYHGNKAKNKSFNCQLNIDLDTSISDISIVPQDIGRVLLNICINAFYAVEEAVQKSDSTYQPRVGISTLQLEDGIEIKIKDNGSGIPFEIQDKIFQPFFTTKPSGKGTGLGLSLAYDILKSHGGELSLESIPQKGCTFIIYLPCV
jgi:two-component system, NtrC family, sensor kinase